MSLITPDVIRTLQRKLYTKAEQEPAYRFYWKAGYTKFPSRDLYDRHGLHPLPKGPGWKTAHALV